MRKTIGWALEPATSHAPTDLARRWAAASLRRAGAALTRWAGSVHRHEPVLPVESPVLEFYAEAGAPEGALYVDGQLIGVLKGVTRL